MNYLEKIIQDNKEFREMLCRLLDGGMFNPGSSIRPTGGDIHLPIGGESSRRGFVNLGQFKPPFPEGIQDGQISKGYTFKFQTEIPVIDKDGKIGLRESYITEHAFLHLQLIEVMHINEKLKSQLGS